MPFHLWKTEDMEPDLSRYAPGFSIEIGGQENKDLYKSIVDLDVVQNLEGPSTFSISLNENDRAKPFRWLDSKFLEPRKEDVVIKIGYSGSMKNAIIARINSLEPSFPSSGTPTLVVQGYDHYHELQNSHPKKENKLVFNKKTTYKEIVEEIATVNKLGMGEIELRNKSSRELCIREDWSYAYILEDLAERLGCEVFVRDKQLHFRPPKYGSKEITALEWGKSLISFTPRLSIARVVTEATLRGQVEGKEVQAVVNHKDLSYKEPNSKSGVDLLRSVKATAITRTNIPFDSMEEAKIRAKSILENANNELISGECECLGNPEIIPGKNVRIKGVGKRFNGKYYVIRATHNLGAGGYTTSLELRRGFVGKV